MSDIIKEKDGSLKVTIPPTVAKAVIKLEKINNISLTEAYFEIFNAGVTKKFPEYDFLKQK